MPYRKQISVILAAITVIILHVQIFSSILAYAELLNRQETLDRPNDVSSKNFSSTGDESIDVTLANEVSEANRVVDIKSVSYYTQGNSLNTIFWLSTFYIYPRFDTLFSLNDELNFRYGMLIDITSNNKEGVSPFDYDVSMRCSCHPNNITWTQVYSELSYNNSNLRVLKETKLENSVYAENQTLAGDNYVLVPVDLGIIGLPEEYRLLFYSNYSYGFNPTITVGDITNMVTIPPPTLSLSVLPPAIEIRRGETKDIVLQVNASKQFSPLVHLSDNNENRDIGLTLSRSQLNVPSFGMDRTGLTITASHNARLGSYPILLSANAIFSDNKTSIASDFVETNMANNSITIEAEDITAQTVLLIDVKPALDLSQQIRGAWEDWGQAVTGFNALIIAIVAGLSPFFANTIRKKLKHA